MDELYLPLAPGLGDQQEAKFAQLGEGTVNFYPDGEGYLVNYPGRIDFFIRDDQLPANLGTPPVLDSITRVLTFRDVRGKEHIVFVQGAVLSEVYGNGYRDLYTFVGQSYEGGHYFPHLFVHESKLVVANPGDPVLLWDGRQGIHHLGVQETPLPPVARCGPAPWTEDSTASAGADGKGYGPWKYQCYWWVGKTPVNGPGDNLGADGTTKVYGAYEVVYQYFDEYGNHGPVSPASSTVLTKPNTDVSAPGVPGFEDYTDTPTYQSPWFTVVDYYPPAVEEHIRGVRVGRTLSLNLDGGAGARGVYFTEVVVFDVTTGRAVLQLSDGNLASGTLIDSAVRGPPQAAMGCSWGRRIVLAGNPDDPFEVSISDVGLFGQFKFAYQAADHVKCVIPLRDRLGVITRSSLEVLYDDGLGNIAVLEADRARGSVYGRSFLEVEGGIFGLWNDGFGFYDGKSVTYVDAPYFVQDIYLDARSYVYAAARWGAFYVLSVRKDFLTDGNNYLLLFHMDWKQWYLLDESVFDVTVWKDVLLGCDDSIYELFRGEAASAVLALHGLLPPERTPLTQRSLLDVRLLVEPSSSSDLTLTIDGEYGDQQSSSSSRPTHSLPSKGAVDRQVHPAPYWNERFEYAAVLPWQAPRDFWMRVGVGNPMVAFSHSLTVTTPAGHPFRIKALGLTFGPDARGPVG